MRRYANLPVQKPHDSRARDKSRDGHKNDPGIGSGQIGQPFRNLIKCSQSNKIRGKSYDFLPVADVGRAAACLRECLCECFISAALLPAGCGN